MLLIRLSYIAPLRLDLEQQVKRLRRVITLVQWRVKRRCVVRSEAYVHFDHFIKIYEAPEKVRLDSGDESIRELKSCTDWHPTS